MVFQFLNQLELTAADLTAKRKQTKMILNTVKQGIFLLDENLNLEDERSQFFDTLFVNVRDNHSFLELIKNKLPQRDFVATKDYLELFFNETVNPTLLSSINPIDKILMTFTGDKGEITYTWLEFEFERILLKNGSVQILGLFKDVTERVLLEEKLLLEENESSKNMENLFQVIHVNPELMNEFLKDSEDEINKINELLRVETKDTASVINHIFTIVHSIKGNALLLGLNNIATKLQEFEEYIKELKVTDPTWRELLKLTVNLAELKHDIYGIKELIGKIMTFQKKVGGKANNSKFILEETLRKFINKLSLEYDKSIDLNIEGYDINLIPEKYRRLFKDTINQFIRNSVAHGLEHSDERVTLKKGPVGTISISLKKHGDNLEFIFRDDGSGLSIKKLKASAIKNKGFSQDQMKNMKNADIVKLIFHPGFSTANSVNEIAGQGVGMSVIKNHVESAGGKLSIKSSTGKFCEFKILLPV
ncbi:MAG: hypothetical protein B6229_07395 [Spirochaetaceae bacterium 4572_7]|nr:MAG: hypothetical protein B6229_07395 [Spirochaetaceae bacterium 4572_7]